MGPYWCRQPELNWPLQLGKLASSHVDLAGKPPPRGRHTPGLHPTAKGRVELHARRHDAGSSRPRLHSHFSSPTAGGGHDPQPSLPDRSAFETVPHPCAIHLPRTEEGGVEPHPIERIGFQPSLVPQPVPLPSTEGVRVERAPSRVIGVQNRAGTTAALPPVSSAIGSVRQPIRRGTSSAPRIDQRATSRSAPRSRSWGHRPIASRRRPRAVRARGRWRCDPAQSVDRTDPASSRLRSPTQH